MNDSGYEYPHLTQEYIFLDKVLADGQVPAIVEGTITLSETDTTGAVWKLMDFVGGRFGLFYDGTLPAAEYTVWVRIPDNPENSIVQAGRIRLT